MSSGWWLEGEAGTSTARELKDALDNGDSLSREALDACVGKISRQIDESTAHIYETINRHYSDFVNVVAFSETMQAEVNALAADLSDIEGQAKKGRLANIINSAQEQRVLAKRLGTTKSAVGVLQQLCKVDGLLRSFDTAVERGQYDVAAQAVAEAGRLVTTLVPETENGCDPKIFAAIRSDYRRKRAKLKAELDGLWVAAVVWGGAGGPGKVGMDDCLTVSTSVPAPHGRCEVELRVVVDGLRHTEMLDRKLTVFAEQAAKVVLEPMLKAPGTAISVDRKPKTVTLGLTKRATVRGATRSKRGGDPNADVAVVAAVYTSAEQLFQLVAGAFGDDVTVRRAVGTSLWPRFSAVVIERVLGNKVSAQRSKQEQLVQIVELTRGFEATVRSLGFIGDDDAQLTGYLAEITVHTANNRRQELLETAREYLSADNFNTVLVKQDTERGGLFKEYDDVDDTAADKTSAACGGVTSAASLTESLYRLPQCHVSVSTKSLLDLAYDSLADMSGMEPEEATMVFYGVRDMFDLFRAVVPIKNREMLLQVPQLCAVFHNDCFYLAHHLLTLGHQFRSALPASMQPLATFVDMVPSFRALGEGLFSQMLHRQRTELGKAVGACGLGDIDEPARFEEVQRVIQQALHQLGQLAGVWKGVLPLEIYLRAVGSIADVVVGALQTSVFQLEDISSVQTQKLRSLFEPVLLTVPLHFDKVGGATVGVEAAREYIARWSKFQDVYEVLDAGLRDIVAKHKAGGYAVSAAELRGLIKAIFSNSELRAKCLSELR